MKMNSGSTYEFKFWMCIIEDVDEDKNKFYMKPHQNYTGGTNHCVSNLVQVVGIFKRFGRSVLQVGHMQSNLEKVVKR